MREILSAPLLITFKLEQLPFRKIPTLVSVALYPRFSEGVKYRDLLFLDCVIIPFQSSTSSSSSHRSTGSRMLSFSLPVSDSFSLVWFSSLPSSSCLCSVSLVVLLHSDA